MWIQIHSKSTKPLFESGNFDNFVKVLPSLKADDTKYYLRIYGEEKMASERFHLKPVERDDIFIRKKSRLKDLLKLPPSPPPEAGPLILCVQFTLDNDRPIAKKIRWAFAREEPNGDYSTYRIKLKVRPSVQTVFVTMVSFTGVILLSVLFENWVDALSAGKSWATIAQESGWALGLAIVFGFILERLRRIYSRLI